MSRDLAAAAWGKLTTRPPRVGEKRARLERPFGTSDGPWSKRPLRQRPSRAYPERRAGSPESGWAFGSPRIAAVESAVASSLPGSAQTAWLGACPAQMTQQPTGYIAAAARPHSWA